MSRSQIMPSAAPNQPSSVAGKRISELAKIGGITPDMLSLNGRGEVWPPQTRVPTRGLGEFTGNFAWARPPKDTKTGTPRAGAPRRQASHRRHGPGAPHPHR